MENLYDHYKEELKRTDIQPGYLLARMYCEVFELPYNKIHTSRFSQLVKLYGKEAVFNAVIEISFNRELTHDNIVGLISYICKKNKEKVLVNKSGSTDLSDLVKLRLEKIKNIQPVLEVRNPFDE